MNKEVYVHYGSNHFLRDYFLPITNNVSCTDKPLGGLWASPTNDVDIGWETWCRLEGFKIDSLDKCFFFTLKDNARILTLSTPDDLVDAGISLNCFFDGIDFEELKKHYDAIQVYIQRGDTYNNNLRHFLMDWDVDSLLVMNPNVIEEVI